MTPAVCPICNSSNISIFLKRKKVPIHQNMIFHDRKSAVESITGNLTMTVCKNCGFVFNKDFNESLLSYDENYDNSQTFSPLFKRYVSKLVHYILEKKFVKNCNIFEVGCGKGFFLRKLVENGRGNRGYGFDPAYDGPLEELEGKIRFYRDYYAPDFVDVKADIVVCRHVIEHVTNPTSLMQDIHKAFKMSQTARVFLETPCVERTWSPPGRSREKLKPVPPPACATIKSGVSVNDRIVMARSALPSKPIQPWAPQ